MTMEWQHSVLNVLYRIDGALAALVNIANDSRQALASGGRALSDLDEQTVEVNRRYQMCALRIWKLFKRDPLPDNHPAHFYIERLEALLDLNLLQPTGAELKPPTDEDKWEGDTIYALFQRLWTKAVSTPYYNKAQWQRLEAWLYKSKAREPDATPSPPPPPPHPSVPDALRAVIEALEQSYKAEAVEKERARLDAVLFALQEEMGCIDAIGYMRRELQKPGSTPFGSRKVQ